MLVMPAVTKFSLFMTVTHHFPAVNFTEVKLVFSTRKFMRFAYLEVKLAQTPTFQAHKPTSREVHKHTFRFIISRHQLKLVYVTCRINLQSELACARNSAFVCAYMCACSITVLSTCDIS